MMEILNDYHIQRITYEALPKNLFTLHVQLNIIHLSQRKDRWNLLIKELREEGIEDYKIWEGIIDTYNPAKGISKAHKQIVQYAKHSNLPEILVAEDDLKFTAKGAFEFYMKNKPTNYDMYLGGIYFGELAADNAVTDFSGLTFYTISQKFYDKFLLIPEHDNLDRSLRNAGKFFVCNPFAVIQYNGFSDNAKRYCNYDRYFEKRKLFNSSD